MYGIQDIAIGEFSVRSDVQNNGVLMVDETDGLCRTYSLGAEGTGGNHCPRQQSDDAEQCQGEKPVIYAKFNELIHIAS